MKHSTITLILIQLFVISAMVGALSPVASAVQNNENATASNSDFPELPAREDIGSDWFDRADDFKPEFVPGEVLVKFRTGISTGSTNGIVTTGIASVDKLNKRFEAKGIERVFSNVYKLKLPKDASVLSVAREYETDPNVEYAEPNGIVHASLVPNDAEYWKQWAPKVTQAELAWNTTTGNSSVLVAVVDTGIDYDHPDLDANYVALGYDWMNNDANPMDDNGHGTHCAGIIAAEINNNIGVAGLAQVQIMAEKALNSYGVGTHSTVAKGIMHASNQSADIISMSLGGMNGSTLQSAIEYAYNASVLLIASAGNDATNKKEESYPAAYPEVVAVSATDAGDDPAWFTNFGDWIEVAAPGLSTYSTLWNDAYTFMSGTSMACPHVAGVAALILSRFPNMTRDEVRYQLRNTTDDLGDPGRDDYYGYGRINARWAVDHESPENDLRAWGMQTPKVLKPGTEATINCTVLNFGKNDKKNVFVRLLVNGSMKEQKKINNISSYQWTTINFSWTPATEGWYDVTSYIVPHGSEGFVNNNAMSINVLVRQEKIAKVPEDYPGIQQAIGAASSGYTVQVAPGTYYGQFQLNKPLTLVGENRTTTILDGDGIDSVVVYIAGSNTNMSQFTIQNAFQGIFLSGDHNQIVENTVTITGEYGVYTVSSYNTIRGNTITNSTYGIYSRNTQHNTIAENLVSNNDNGIYLDEHCNNTIISSNTVSNTYVGITIRHFTTVWGNNSVTGNKVLNNKYDFPSTSRGILLKCTTNNTINANTLSNNKDNGIYLHSSRYNNITENWVSNNDYGINLYGSLGNTIYHNNFINNTIQATASVSSGLLNTWDDGYPSGGNYWSDYTGTDLYSGSYQNETGSDGIGDTSYEINQYNKDNYPLIRPWGSIRNIDTDLIYLTIQNAVDAPETLGGHTIEVKADTYYEEVVVNKSLTIIGEDPSNTIIYSGSWGDSGFLVYSNDTTITGFAVRSYTKCIDLWGCNCKVSGNAFENFEYAIYLEDDSSNNIISNNDMSTWGGSYGIYLICSDNNTIVGNTVIGKFIGTYIAASNYNTIRNNTFSYCIIGPISSHSGIYLRYSNYTAISNNTITYNEDYGIYIQGANNTVSNNIISDNERTGIFIGGDDNIVSNNTISNNDGGICISWGSFNIFSGNTISNNNYGLFLMGDNNNVIYHNNFVDNTLQADTFGETNVWDDGYPSGGNYWSDYTGVDEKSGPNQDQPGSDGIGDTPYVIDENNQDNYPLMDPWNP